MNNELIFKLCLDAASKIVAAEKELYPGCEDAVNISVGGGTGGETTDWDRDLHTTNWNKNDLPGNLSSLVNQAFTQVPITSAVNNAELSMLEEFLGRVAGNIPNFQNLKSVADMALSPGGFQGESSLQRVYNRDPYGGTYENETNDLYERSFDKARAAAKSGPTNVRGGVARNSFELAELDTNMSQNRFREVDNAQKQQAGLTNQSVQLANMIEAGRRGQAIQGAGLMNQNIMGRDQQRLEASAAVSRNRNANAMNLGLASKLLGTHVNEQRDDSHGHGHSSSWNFGGEVGCCFIFLEALNGTLPWFVRESRDFYCTPTRRDGYNRMARVLVPLMRSSRLVRGAVNFLMIKPCLKFGAWDYQAKEDKNYSKVGWVFRPVVEAWFKIWDFVGGVK
jgi:hypothetical protein